MLKSLEKPLPRNLNDKEQKTLLERGDLSPFFNKTTLLVKKKIECEKGELSLFLLETKRAL